MNLLRPKAVGTRLRRRRRASMLALAGSCLLCGTRGPAFEAIPAVQWLGDQLAGYAAGGAGFAFSPQTNIFVTSLGFGGLGLGDEPYRVSLWDTNGDELAQAVVTTNSPSRNGTYYEPVQRFELGPGVKYYLSAVGTDGGAWSGSVLVGAGPGLNGTFSVGPDLSYLAFALGTNANGVFPLAEGADTMLAVGANFEYATRPVIVITGVALEGNQARLDFSVSGGPASSFIQLEAGQASGPWLTNANASLTTNVPEQAFTFTSSQQNQVRFFRVLAP